MSSKIYFITGNKNKCEEIKVILPAIEQFDIDLPEIQDFDAKKIIKAKILTAFEHQKNEFIVEDTSLYLDCLNGLPGPLIKWFLKIIGNEGIYNLVSKLGNTKAKAKTFIGYAKNPEEIHFFEGSINGEIVSPRGESRFGWDSIFQPENNLKTFAEMTMTEKNKISMRRIAATKLKNFLEKEVY